MAVAPERERVAGGQRYRFTVDEFARMGEAGIFTDSSLRYDKQEKVPRYGRAGVPETWLVDLDAREVTVYTDPGPGGYASRQVRHRGDDVVAAGMPEIRVAVDDVFAGVGNPAASETADRVEARRRPEGPIQSQPTT